MEWRLYIGKYGEIIQMIEPVTEIGQPRRLQCAYLRGKAIQWNKSVCLSFRRRIRPQSVPSRSEASGEFQRIFQAKPKSTASLPTVALPLARGPRGNVQKERKIISIVYGNGPR